MGVFTVGRQVALEIDMPGWWLANASIDMDFRRGLYYDSATANPQAATNFLSCSRASIGYAKNADGTLTQFANDTLRIGVGTGLLVEDARTNYFIWSEEIQLGSNVVADQATAPNGTLTMDQFLDGTGTGRHIYGPQITGFSAGSTKTFSVFAKDIDRRYVELLIQGDTTSGEIYAFFDLQTGTVTDSGIAIAGTGASFISANVESYASGIFRLSLTGIPNSADTGIYVITALSDRATLGGSLDGGCPSYTGTNKSIYFWGAQLEVASFVSSYIPTTAAAASRASENITTSGSLQTVINAATASLVAQTDNGAVSNVAANIVDSNGTNLLGFDATNHALASITATLATGNTANRTTQDKLGIAWSGAGRSLVLNNGTVVTDASAQTPSATQHIGSSGSANFACAYIERLTAWSSKLADATLQALTAP